MTDKTTPREVLSEERYARLVQSARDALGTWARAMGEEKVHEVVVTVLASAGFLTPPSDPDPETCSAMFPDEAGDWWQCQEEPGHDLSGGHDAGEWSWPDGHPEAVPPRT
ncbi:hypothetical protein AB0B15_38500 [Streptomyces sp. NPDC045456]|uniref:hypothetical protein n=1 Tax=Streptomyces sp. NPDC045456 TaxID=3155254 RepID=UPI0033E37A95